jgi:hypothetical protein
VPFLKRAFSLPGSSLKFVSSKFQMLHAGTPSTVLLKCLKNSCTSSLLTSALDRLMLLAFLNDNSLCLARKPMTNFLVGKLSLHMVVLPAASRYDFTSSLKSLKLREKPQVPSRIALLARILSSSSVSYVGLPSMVLVLPFVLSPKVVLGTWYLAAATFTDMPLFTA